MACAGTPGPPLPPAPAASFCPALSLTSRATWQLVSRSFAKKLDDAPRTVDERAVTDVALIALEAFSASKASVTLFTTGQEAATGADFELQVFNPAGNRLSFMIQAKALKLPTSGNEGYPALCDQDAGPPVLRQYDKLIASCGPGGTAAGSAPMHVFYNGARLMSTAPWPADRCAAPAPLDEEARGITIAHTSSVVAAITMPSGRLNYRVGGVAAVCWPWWCFFCCAISTLAELAARAATPPGAAGAMLPVPTIFPPAAVPAYATVAREHRFRRSVEQPDGIERWWRGSVEPPDGIPPPARTVVTLELGDPPGDPEKPAPGADGTP